MARRSVTLVFEGEDRGIARAEAGERPVTRPQSKDLDEVRRLQELSQVLEERIRHMESAEAFGLSQGRGDKGEGGVGEEGQASKTLGTAATQEEGVGRALADCVLEARKLMEEATRDGWPRLRRPRKNWLRLRKR